MNEAAAQTRPASRHRILLVEDERDIRDLVRYSLEQEGFIVDEAADADTALERIARRAPDLMVLDVMLPRNVGARDVPPDARAAADGRDADSHAHRQGRRG